MKKRRKYWVALVKKIYMVDPLYCLTCSREMKVITVIEKCQGEVIEQILRHYGLWESLP